MQIFLQILAVIGIVLLCIIGLVLLLLGLVLFVPVRYKLWGNRTGEATEVRIWVTWLLHFVSVNFFYPEPGEVMVRVLGRKVWSMKPGQEPDKEETVESETAPKKAAGTETVQRETVQRETENTEAQNKSETSEATSKEPEETKKPEDAPSGFEKIRCKIRELCDKIKKIIENYRYYRDLLQKKENRLLFERCKTRLFKVLKSIRPKVLRADLTVGTGEPDTTGYVLAVAGVLYPLMGDHVNITPDFEEKILEGNVFVKGKVTIFTLLYQGVRIYFDDQLHVFIDGLKRKDV